MNKKHIFRPLVLSLFVLLVSDTAFTKDKDTAESGYPVTSEEQILIDALNSNKGAAKELFDLGLYYFNQAVDYDMKYLWGKPRNLKENQEKALFYSIKAMEYLKKALAIDKKNADGFAKLTDAIGLRMRNGGLGTKMSYMGEFKANLDRALSIDPDNTEALITKAYKTLYSPSLFVNKYKSAKRQFESLYKKHPDNPHVVKGLAIVHKETGDRSKALDLITKTLKLAPNDLEAIGLKEEIDQKLKGKN